MKPEVFDRPFRSHEILKNKDLNLQLQKYLVIKYFIYLKNLVLLKNIIEYEKLFI